MKYCVENQLALFEFHDSDFSFVGFENNSLSFSAEHLNIHKDAKENPNYYDMELGPAEIIFHNIEVLTYEPAPLCKQDADGSWYTATPETLLTEEAKTRFLNDIPEGFTVYSFEVTQKENKYYAEIVTCAGASFTATFTFDRATVSWDVFCKKAWYEFFKRYTYPITLSTPEGELETSATITCREKDPDTEDESVPYLTVSVGVTYKGKEIWAQGTDYLWVDAFANLEKRLPDGVAIKCCMTCRHGNMCPYGNWPGELFCTKDLIIGSKDDMIDLFDKEDENTMDLRKRKVTDSCGEYCHQSWDYYTYNDYLYYV